MVRADCVYGFVVGDDGQRGGLYVDFLGGGEEPQLYGFVLADRGEFLGIGQ